MVKEVIIKDNIGEKIGVGEYEMKYKTFLGLVMCVIYALAYIGFIFISLYDVSLMDKKMPLGLNLGTFYGFGLIVLAFALGVIYTFVCGFYEKKFSRQSEAAQSFNHSTSGDND